MLHRIEDEDYESIRLMTLQGHQLGMESIVLDDEASTNAMMRQVGNNLRRGMQVMVDEALDCEQM